MNKEITRAVIMDLLPAYVANEASPETRALVQEYLATDPELAALVKDSKLPDLKEGVPPPLKREEMMEAYKQARRYIYLKTVVVAVVICVTLLLLCAMFFGTILLTRTPNPGF